MASPSLSSLARELQLTIFQSLDSFADVSALMRTSQVFHAIWTLNMSSICSHVLPRAIVCLADAQDLIVIQERSTPNEMVPQNDILGTGRIKQLLSNQHSAYAVCRRIEASCKASSGEYKSPFVITNHTERLHFLRRYYRFWTFFEIFKTCSTHRVITATLKNLRSDERSRDMILVFTQVASGHFTHTFDWNQQLWQAVDALFEHIDGFCTKIRDGPPKIGIA